MAQAYDPLQPDRTFAASYLTINSSDEALRTLHSGTSAPTSPVAYMLWADTANNLLKQRSADNLSWITIAQIGVTNGGHLTTAGGTMSGDIAMGGFRVTGLGAASAANDAVRKAEHDLKAPLAAPAFTGDATVNQDPAGGTSIVRRSWALAQFLALAGGSMTGLFNLFADATSALHAVTLQQLKTFVQFNLSTGHRHDGTDARKVRGTDLDTGAATSGQALRANGSGGATFSTVASPDLLTTPTVLADENPASSSFATITLGPSGLGLTSTGDPVAIIYIQAFSGTQLRLRPNGSVDDSASMNFDVGTTWGDWGRRFDVELDSAGAFQYRRSGTSAHTVIRFGGRFKVC